MTVTIVGSAMFAYASTAGTGSKAPIRVHHDSGYPTDRTSESDFRTEQHEQGTSHPRLDSVVGAASPAAVVVYS